MYRGVIIMILVGGIFGGSLPLENEFSTKKVRQLGLIEGLVNPDNDNQGQLYPVSSETSLPVQHFYPTYPDHIGKSGYVQSGFDGFLIPVPPSKPTWTSSFISAVMPLMSYALSFGARAGQYMFNFVVLLFIGAILTTSICTFTPFCTITFLGFGINKNQIREQVSELARMYITPESMNAATLLVKRAIEKYAELQRQQSREAEQELNGNNKKYEKITKRRRR